MGGAVSIRDVVDLTIQDSCSKVALSFDHIDDLLDMNKQSGDEYSSNDAGNGLVDDVMNQLYAQSNVDDENESALHTSNSSFYSNSLSSKNSQKYFPHQISIPEDEVESTKPQVDSTNDQQFSSFVSHSSNRSFVSAPSVQSLASLFHSRHDVISYIDSEHLRMKHGRSIHDMNALSKQRQQSMANLNSKGHNNSQGKLSTGTTTASGNNSANNSNSNSNNNTTNNSSNNINNGSNHALGSNHSLKSQGSGGALTKKRSNNNNNNSTNSNGNVSNSFHGMDIPSANNSSSNLATTGGSGRVLPKQGSGSRKTNLGSNIQDDIDWIQVSDDDDDDFDAYNAMPAITVVNNSNANTGANSIVNHTNSAVGVGSGGNTNIAVGGNNPRSRMALSRQSKTEYSNQSYLFTQSGTIFVDGFDEGIHKYGIISSPVNKSNKSNNSSNNSNSGSGSSHSHSNHMNNGLSPVRENGSQNQSSTENNGILPNHSSSDDHENDSNINSRNIADIEAMETEQEDGANNNESMSLSSLLTMSERLVLLGRLGQGASSVVYKALDVVNMRLVAVKMISIFDRSKRRQMVRELATLFDIMKSCHLIKKTSASDVNHPESNDLATGDLTDTIVEFYDAFSNLSQGRVCLSLEYMDGGSLQDLVDEGGARGIVTKMRDNNIKLHKQLHGNGNDRPHGFNGEDSVIRELMSQKWFVDSTSTLLAGLTALCVESLCCLHDQLGVLHRDLKPANYLVTRGGQVKLADLGIARKFRNVTFHGSETIAEEEPPAVTSFVGTLLYLSPERLEGLSYGPPSDIWSLGMCLLTIALGGHPLERGPHSQGGYWEVRQKVSKVLGSSSSTVSIKNDYKFDEFKIEVNRQIEREEKERLERLGNKNFEQSSNVTLSVNDNNVTKSESSLDNTESAESKPSTNSNVNGHKISNELPSTSLDSKPVPSVEQAPSESKTVQSSFPNVVTGDVSYLVSFLSPREFSEEFIDFVSHCMHITPTNRPSARTLMDHPLLKRAKIDPKQDVASLRATCEKESVSEFRGVLNAMVKHIQKLKLESELEKQATIDQLAQQQGNQQISLVMETNTVENEIVAPTSSLTHTPIITTTIASNNNIDNNSNTSNPSSGPGLFVGGNKPKLTIDLNFSNCNNNIIDNSSLTQNYNTSGNENAPVVAPLVAPGSTGIQNKPRLTLPLTINTSMPAMNVNGGMSLGLTLPSNLTSQPSESCNIGEAKSPIQMPNFDKMVLGNILDLKTSQILENIFTFDESSYFDLDMGPHRVEYLHRLQSLASQLYVSHNILADTVQEFISDLKRTELSQE